MMKTCKVVETGVYCMLALVLSQIYCLILAMSARHAVEDCCAIPQSEKLCCRKQGGISGCSLVGRNRPV